MNFLGHSFLSPENDLIQIGNTLGDFIKGKNLTLHPDIEKGVKLHRQIDLYTDNHLLFKKCYDIFKPEFSLFSGILVDMYFDYFLAKNWNNFHSKSLLPYTIDLYSKIDKNLNLLPEKARLVYPYMSENNWLFMYKTHEGMEQILKQLSARLKNRSLLHESMPKFKQNEELLQGHFEEFLKEIKQEFKDFT